MAEDETDIEVLINLDTITLSHSLKREAIFVYFVRFFTLESHTKAGGGDGTPSWVFVVRKDFTFGR